MAKEDNLAPPFKKGQSGNPKGYPKGRKNMSTILRELIEMEREGKHPLTGEHGKYKVAELLNLKLLEKALKGDNKSINDIFDRTEGKPLQVSDNKHSGDLSVGLLSFKETEQAIDEDEEK